MDSTPRLKPRYHHRPATQARHASASLHGTNQVPGRRGRQGLAPGDAAARMPSLCSDQVQLAKLDLLGHCARDPYSRVGNRYR